MNKQAVAQELVKVAKLLTAADWYGLFQKESAAEKFMKALKGWDVTNVYGNKVQDQYEVHFETSLANMAEIKKEAVSLGGKVVKG